MAPSKLDDPPYYHPLPPDNNTHQEQQQNYVAIPIYFPAILRRQWRSLLICASTLILLAVSVYILWPSDPDLKVVRLRLDNLHIRSVPKIALDVKLDLTVKVRNPDLYSMDYESLVVSIGYRGKQLGFVSSDHGHVTARGSSYVNATLELDGVDVLSDFILLLEDLARGSIQFDTVTEVSGLLGLFFFELPLKVTSATSTLIYNVLNIW